MIVLIRNGSMLGMSNDECNTQYLSPFHDWEHRLKTILDELVILLENDTDVGYFDSIIDVQSHAELIRLMTLQYSDNHNARYCKKTEQTHTQRLNPTLDQIKEQYRGGYNDEFKRRLESVLT